MRAHFLSVAVALLIGLLGSVVFFTSGSVSDRESIGVVAAMVFFLYGGVFLVRKYPASGWYGGAITNAPIWLVFKLLADPGQFEIYVLGLVGCLVSSYAGSYLGLWLQRRKVLFGKTTIIMLIVLPVLALVLTTFLLNAPRPIAHDKNGYVGVWSTGSGFTLEIKSDGTGKIVQDVHDRGATYDNLNIKVAPSQIEAANVEFWGDSILFIVRHRYYARAYRIDRSPYPDSGLSKMVLNGVILVRQ